MSTIYWEEPSNQVGDRKYNGQSQDQLRSYMSKNFLFLYWKFLYSVNCKKWMQIVFVIRKESL